MMTKKILLALCAVALTASPLIAQKDTASLEGRVLDAGGAVIASASVTATNLSTNFSYHATSDTSGQWTISPVRVGTYQVTIVANGFKEVVVQPVILDVQQRQRVDATLQPGQVTQQIEVQSTPPALQTDTSELGQLVDNKVMVGMPLNGRNPVQLAQLTVGVNQNEPGARTTSSYGFSANGARSIDNSFLLDGIDNNSNLADLLNEANYVIMPPPDALQEFKIEASNYDAEFGRSIGAIVNAVTRSGSNEFHGVLYEFFRNQHLNAMNYYDVALQPFHQNQFGATLGGPILRDKLFFFVDYEGLRISQGEPNTSLVPTPAQTSGDFSSQLDLSSPTGVPDCNGVLTYQGELFDTTLTQPSAATPSGYCGVPFGYVNGVPSNVIPSSRIDQLGNKLIHLYPAPNTSAPGYNYLSDPMLTQSVNQGDVRIDQTISSADNAFYRFSMSRSPEIIPSPFSGYADGGGFFSGIQQINAYSAVASESHVFSPREVNELRLGFNRQYVSRFEFNYSTNVAQQLQFPGVPDSPQQDLGGLPQLTFSDASTLGSPTFLPAIESQETYSVSDTYTVLSGHHTLKLGGELRPEAFTLFEPAAARGYMNFVPQFTDNPGDPGTGGSGLATLLTGQPNGGGINNLEHGAYMRQTFAVFAQDDWRMTPALSVNLGLRYDYFTLPREHSNGQSNFNPTTGKLDIPKDSNLTLPASESYVPVNHDASNVLLKPDHTNISPRAGFAYQVNPALVVQSAFGVFFNPDEPGIWGFMGENPPFLASQTYVTPCSLPSYNSVAQDCSIPGLAVLSQGFPADSLSNPNTPTMTAYEENFRTPYVMEWHLTTQYQLQKNNVFSLSYVGSKGNKEYIEPNGNQAAPTADPSAPTAPRRPFPYIDAPIYEIETQGNSNYNALQTSLTRRLSAGLSAMVNYTYSKALGDASTTMGSQNNDAFRWSKEPNIEYGPLDFDVRNRFVGSFIYELPFGRGQRFGGAAGSMMDRVIGHWTATGIVTLNSGNWFTVTDGNANFANSDGQQRPNFVSGQKVNGKPCIPGTFFNTCAFTNPPLGSFGNVSLNSLEGPGYQDVDLALQKIIPVSERLRLELRAESFNLFNHPNFLFAAPGPQNSNSSTILGTPTFGYVTAAQSPREIQVAGKLYF